MPESERLQKLEVQYVPVEDVSPNEYNPNSQDSHEFTMLKKSIDEDGMTQPIIVVEDDGGGYTIVDGEHRWKACQELGMAEIPVVAVPMTEEQRRVATLRHNKARGKHDLSLEAEVVKDLERLDALDWAQDALLLDEATMDHLLSEATVDGGPMDFSPNGDDPEDVKQQRKAEEEYRERKQAEEREKASEESETYRLVCIFHGDEADVVREALGNAPAKALYELCQEEAA